MNATLLRAQVRCGIWGAIGMGEAESFHGHDGGHEAVIATAMVGYNSTFCVYMSVYRALHV